LKDFILEFGQDFSLVGEEYKLQVGNSDFFVDLLFFNRELSCLVAIDLLCCAQHNKSNVG
jgi:predicted nuclease of restriction endonuclease-like (RecB) superfamily